MDLYIQAWKKFADFSRRARRKEFWLWMLFNTIISYIILYICGLFVSEEQTQAIDSALMNGDIALYASLTMDMMISIMAPYFLFILLTFVPSLAVTVRRLHDIGKSGWMYFIVLIPLAGPIWMLVLLVTESQEGDNQYGPNPKGVVLDFES